eukprot:CAMPEP_0180809926 /NCGR_PEP_ID=MMETSP1038_2-20121128/64591_1 /TAXON_ID=632150 /ORGANISM="Azadinium spinosum, Strain 3D9" /LENGTH=276 /DNA_ID=CAMNT_0022851141 /DNA_START=1 /DNA_END=828 /DNA_ORIENTATION=-
MQVLELLQVGRGTEVAEPAPGLLVANDFKSVRLNRLIERARRVPAAPLLTTCADARKYPKILWTGERVGRVRFDRVLCDVPCSGDGTVRKARGLLAVWNPRGGLCHHADQLAILCRGIELLAPGGLLCYSTCALNPVECEAVVAAALDWAQGSVTLVPVTLPGLRLAPGLTSWLVPAPKMAKEGKERKEGKAKEEKEEVEVKEQEEKEQQEGGEVVETSDIVPGSTTYGAWEEVPHEERNSGQIRRSMFPPAAYASPPAAAARITAQLPLCARLLP